VSNPENTKLFEAGVLASLQVSMFGRTKSRRDLARQLAAIKDMDQKSLNVSIDLFDSARFKRVTKAKRDASFVFHKFGKPWNAKVNNRNGGVEKDGDWLILAKNVYDFEKEISAQRMLFEQAIKEDVIDAWDDIVATGVSRLRLTEEEVPIFYPSLDVVRSKFRWDLSIEPLWDVRDIQNDCRLKESSDFIEKRMQSALASQNQKIVHVVQSMVDKVTDVVSEQSSRMSGFTHGDKSADNSMPKAPTWEKTLPGLADEIESWAPVVTGDENNPLMDAAQQIRQLVSHVKEISDGDFRKTHRILSQEGDYLRKDLKGKLDNISRTATSALEDFLS